MDESTGFCWNGWLFSSASFWMAYWTAALKVAACATKWFGFCFVLLLLRRFTLRDPLFSRFSSVAGAFVSGVNFTVGVFLVFSCTLCRISFRFCSCSDCNGSWFEIGLFPCCYFRALLISCRLFALISLDDALGIGI